MIFPFDSVWVIRSSKALRSALGFEVVKVTDMVLPLKWGKSGNRRGEQNIHYQNRPMDMMVSHSNSMLNEHYLRINPSYGVERSTRYSWPYNFLSSSRRACQTLFVQELHTLERTIVWL